MKLVGRGDTTVVDAYLSPILRRYVDQVAAELRRRAAAVHAIERRPDRCAPLPGQGRDPLRARPAASSARCAPRAAAGFERIIGFDMGGTSTDVSHYAGELEREFETQVAGVRMRAPMMSIHTVAAGGGSILHFDGARYRVGPDSAGANPGPGVLPARRAAHRHRRQRDARQGPAEILPARVRRQTATQPLDAGGGAGASSPS